MGERAQAVSLGGRQTKRAGEELTERGCVSPALASSYTRYSQDTQHNSQVVPVVTRGLGSNHELGCER